MPAIAAAQPRYRRTIRSVAKAAKPLSIVALRGSRRASEGGRTMFYEDFHNGLNRRFAGLSRRSALGGMLAAPALAAATSRPGVVPLDVLSPRENLYGFAKMWGTIGPKAVLSGYQGTQYAIVGSQRAKPLFGYCGFGNIRNTILADGSVKVTGKECGYFTDLATGEIIDHWDNPWTGERVEVFPFLNDRFRGTLGLTRKVFKVGDGVTANNDIGGKVKADDPYLLPWQRIGDQYLLGWDYAHEYTNPVTPEGWPKASTGKRVNRPSISPSSRRLRRSTIAR
ncbi:DUF1838 family protein [Glacieibacterium frigidum]|uniref:DUF1838 domain-containing protein n=1 Tax=Glacieibacterium frigidum TaxID=2593303 RepID=A0A552U8B2_9SPHN|nr:DUF1838 family protein [Glacieibacterium frigidum]TRW14453.1 DUF1838 domain-containing protein [Glacieibacterium frigidum]